MCNPASCRTGAVMELRTCSLPGVHRPLGAGAPGGFHPRPAARHQRRRCHLPLGFHGSACGEVTPSPVSAPLPPLPPLPSVPSRCNAGLVAFPGLVPPSLLRRQEQVSEFAPSRELLWSAALPQLLFMAQGRGWGVDFWFLPSGGGSQIAGANQLISPIGSLRLIGTSQWESAKEGTFRAALGFLVGVFSFCLLSFLAPSLLTPSLLSCSLASLFPLSVCPSLS